MRIDSVFYHTTRLQNQNRTFSFCAAGYLFVSYRLFHLTNTLKTAFVPHDNNQLLLRKVILMTAVVGGMYAVGTAGVSVYYKVVAPAQLASS